MSEQDLIAGRKWAEEVLADLDTEPEDFRFAFLRRMKAEFKVKDLDPGAMTDEQAMKFGRQVISFGTYRDQRYDDAPLSYLEWLADQNSELRRYIKSRRIKEEQRA